MNIEEIKNRLEKYKNFNIKDINPDDILDVKDIKIDKRKSSEERMLDFLSSNENPYVIKVNGKLVQMVFSSSGKTAEDCLTNVLKNLYK